MKLITFNFKTSICPAVLTLVLPIFCHTYRLISYTVADFQVVALITFICSIVFPPYKGDGWVEFVAMSALLTVGINFIFYLIGLRQQLPPFMLLVVSSKAPCLLQVLSLIVFVCACAWHWGSVQAWAQFVALSAFISVLVYFLMNLFNLVSHYPGPWMLVVSTLMFLVGMYPSVFQPPGVSLPRSSLPPGGVSPKLLLSRQACFASW